MTAMLDLNVSSETSPPFQSHISGGNIAGFVVCWFHP